MSQSEPNPQLEAMLQQAIEAAQAGDKATARALLEQIVAQDQYNEKAWFWLASVAETAEEKRVCLGNVIVINPQNERAQHLLDQLEGKSGVLDDAAPAAVPGVSRRAVYLSIGLGAAALVALLAVLFTVLGGSKDNADLADQAGNAAAILDPDSITPTAPPPTLAPSLTPTPLPPTWTPVPTATPVQESIATPLAPPPAGLLGRIIMRSGQVIGDNNNQPIVIVRADGNGTPLVVTAPNERGHAPVLSPDGRQYAFIKYVPGSQDVILTTNNMQGLDPRPSNARWGGDPILLQQDSPAWSPDGKWLAFTAVGPGVRAPDLYRLSLAEGDGSPDALEQLTRDNTIESWPAFSPDSEFIVYAADFSLLKGEPGGDLRIYDIAAQRATDLTTNGATLIESAPDWSPDAQRIVFQAAEAGSGQSDIYWMAADGQSPPEKLIATDAQEIMPRFSPDGKYIVFSSDRTGNWDVFVYEIATAATYQLTSSPVIDIANDWGR